VAGHRAHNRRRIDHYLGNLVHHPVCLLRDVMLLLVLLVPQVLRQLLRLL